MNSPTHPAYHVGQLGALFTRSGTVLDRKLVIVPAAQTGHEILSALSAQGYGWVNVRASTLLRYAREVVEEAHPGTVHRFVSPAGVALTIDRILSESESKDSELMRRSARSMARTIRELRQGGVSVDSHERIATSRFGRLVSNTYRRYLEWLDSTSLMDDASLLEAAIRLYSGSAVRRPPEVLAVFDEVILPDLALTFVEAIASRARETWRIGWVGTVAQPPAHAAAVRLHLWSIPSTEKSGRVTEIPGNGQIEKRPAHEVDFRIATGAENEVRSVFTSIVEAGMALDSVELAYAANDPYLKIIRSLSSRYDMPVTTAAGVAALDTATGQALRAFLGWIGEGLPSVGLVSMLRGGLVRLRSAGSKDRIDQSAAAADILAAVRVCGGRSGYRSALAALHLESVVDAERAAGTFAASEANSRVKALENVEDALSPLLALADLPKSLQVSQLVDCLRRFTGDFAPAIRPPDKNTTGSEEDLTDPLHDLEQIARRELLTRFRQLAEQIDGPVPLGSLLKHAQDLIAEAFVQARAAMPGHIHVVPLSSAGFTGRSNLFVVGLDEITTGRLVPEDPLLSDEAREELAVSGAGRLPISKDIIGRDSWYLSRAASRATGRVTLIHSSYSVGDDRELYPSSGLLKVLTARGLDIADLSVLGFGLSGPRAVPLDETDVFISSRSDPNAEMSCLDRYPRLKRGARSSAARERPEWSVFDGLLGVESEKLNPFRKKSRISASRLQTLARCPFQYFLKYVLGARTPDELDETVWMNALQRGSLVHEGLRKFMVGRQEDGERVVEADLELLVSVFDDELSAIIEHNPPPNPAEKDALEQELARVADAFIVDELARQKIADPFGFEFGFGLWKHRKKRDEDQTEILELDIDGVELRVWGWIDRIDRLKEGGFAVSDYKTGGSRGYDEDDLLDKGRRLQWALYACVVEALLGEPVHLSGYLFPGSREMGRRVEADPALVRSELAAVLRRLGRTARAGMFVQAVEPQGSCQWCDYRRVCGNLEERSRFVNSKLEATGPMMPEYEYLQGWDFADRKLGGHS